MPKKTSADAGLIRLDLYIDPDLHPELFRTLANISEGKRRAAYVKNCAEKFLLVEKTMLLSQSGPNFDSPSATYQTNAGKLQKSSLQLTRTSPVSNTDDFVSATQQAGERQPTEARLPSPTVEQPVTPKAELPITKPALVSGKTRGAAALAGVLHELTPGL